MARSTTKGRQTKRQKVSDGRFFIIWLVVLNGFNPSEKYEFVSWDYYSQLNGKIKTVPNHQPVMVLSIRLANV